LIYLNYLWKFGVSRNILSLTHESNSTPNLQACASALSRERVSGPDGDDGGPESAGHPPGGWLRIMIRVAAEREMIIGCCFKVIGTVTMSVTVLHSRQGVHKNDF